MRPRRRGEGQWCVGIRSDWIELGGIRPIQHRSKDGDIGTAAPIRVEPSTVPADDHVSYANRSLRADVPFALGIRELMGAGQAADIEIGAFLIASGNGLEKQELLRLIGTLV